MERMERVASHQTTVLCWGGGCCCLHDGGGCSRAMVL